MDFRLTLGSLDLCGYPFSIQFGSDLGAPQNVTQALAMLLQDGEIELSSRASNRSISFTVLVEGEDQLALAEAEAALIAETEAPLNKLRVDPGDGYGPPTVYETFQGQVVFVRDDNLEIAGLRRYEVSLQALPYGESATAITTPATGSGTMTAAPTPISAVLDDGSSATNWSGTWSRVSASSGASPTSGAADMSSVTVGSNPALNGRTSPVTSPDNQLTSSYGGSITTTITLTRAFSSAVDVSSTKQIVVAWFWDAVGAQARLFSSSDFYLYVNGNVYCPRVSGTPSPGRYSTTEAIFQIPAGTTSVTSMTFTWVGTSTADFVFTDELESLYVDTIVRNNASSSVSTPRQLQRSVEVKGSARTQADVAIEHSTSALGDVLAYFWPQTPYSYTPPLRQFRASGGAVTADASLVSGAKDNIVGSTTTFDIPVSRVPPGSYLLMVRLGGADTAGQLFWGATTTVNGTEIGPAANGTPLLSLTSAYQMYAVGRMMLPTRDVDPNASASKVRITLTASVTSGTTCYVDEAWLFNTTIGRLTWVPCGTSTPTAGGSANRVFMRSATIDSPRPAIRTGHAADQSDTLHPLVLPSWQPPEFKPPLVNVLTVTSNALDAAVTVTYTPRWHTHSAI